MSNRERRWESNFWSSSESVTWRICMPLVVHSNFSSNFMVTCLQVVRTDFDLFELDRKWNLEQFVNHVIMNSSNPDFDPLPFFRSGSKNFEQFEDGPKAQFDHVIIYFKAKFGWTKSLLLNPNWTKNWTPCRSYDKKMSNREGRWS